MRTSKRTARRAPMSVANVRDDPHTGDDVQVEIPGLGRGFKAPRLGLRIFLHCPSRKFEHHADPRSITVGFGVNFLRRDLCRLLVYVERSALLVRLFQVSRE